MDNNNRNTPNGGLTPENLKWLEEMMDSNTKALEPIPESNPEPVAEKTAEETLLRLSAVFQLYEQ
jgi:hypothetical protein